MSDGTTLPYGLSETRPLIILGMHRSGTSLTARLLGQAGMQMGVDLPMNDESRPLRRINERLMAGCGGSWDAIEPVLAAMDDPARVSEWIEWLAGQLVSRKGLPRHVTAEEWQRIRRQEAVCWGFKDPRTTITFPVWQALFPQARFLHVVRNGHDVALSLHVRARNQNVLWKRFSPVHNHSERMLTLSGCFSLWEDYVAAMDARKDRIPEAQWLEIRYESLLADPERVLGEVLAFSEVDGGAERVAQLAEGINAGRLDNRARETEFSAALETLPASAWMQSLGYGAVE